MFIVDDPMLALIARFVVDVDRLEGWDKEFLQRQIRAIREYVESHPTEQRGEKALEWIEHYAANYRQEWQKRMVSKQISATTCPDCPLVKQFPPLHCKIHDRWVKLINEYLAQEITSREYVEDTLKLLNEHKTRLKVAAIRR